MSDETTDRLDLGMKASGHPLIEGVAAEGRGMGPVMSAEANAAVPAPPPPPPADAAASARPKATGQ